MLTPITDFSVIGNTPATQEAGPKLTVSHGSLAKGVEIPGARLHGQFATLAGSLLLTTENIPYEEALHCLLFDEGLKQIDHLELSNVMTAGALLDLQIKPDETLSFSFFGGDRWQLAVHASAVRTLFSREPGVHWPGASPIAKHYLAISRLE